MKKYELIENDFICLDDDYWRAYRIRALVDFADVKAGDLGGYIQSEENLAQDGEAWVYEGAIVAGGVKVAGDVKVYADAKVSGPNDVTVRGDATISGNAVFTWRYL